MQDRWENGVGDLLRLDVRHSGRNFENGAGYPTGSLCAYVEGADVGVPRPISRPWTWRFPECILRTHQNGHDANSSDARRLGLAELKTGPLRTMTTWTGWLAAERI